MTKLANFQSRISHAFAKLVIKVHINFVSYQSFPSFHPAVSHEPKYAQSQLIVLYHESSIASFYIYTRNEGNMKSREGFVSLNVFCVNRAKKNYLSNYIKFLMKAFLENLPLKGICFIALECEHKSFRLHTMMLNGCVDLKTILIGRTKKNSLQFCD